EELWAHMAGPGAKRGDFLALTAWPQLDGLANQDADEELGWVVKLVSEVRSVRSEMNVSPGARVPLVLVAPSDAIRQRAERHRETVSRLARLCSMSFENAPPKGAAVIAFGDTTAALPLADIIDMAAERARLRREIEKATADIGKIDAKLANPQFVAKAPEEVVEEQRERKGELEALAARLENALKRLEG